MQTYIVSMGDTLYGISSQFGVSIEDIKLENNLSSNVIFVGQVLIIPTTATTSFYIVKKGDTLYSIAKKYQTTTKELMELNNLSTPTLNVGEQLRLPINENDSTEYIVYSVKVNDNLYSIAKKTNSSVDEIKALNNLQSDLLSIGQQLKIPVKSNNTNQIDYQTYTVKKGDTFFMGNNEYRLNSASYCDF